MPARDASGDASERGGKFILFAGVAAAAVTAASVAGWIVLQRQRRAAQARPLRLAVCIVASPADLPAVTRALEVQPQFNELRKFCDLTVQPNPPSPPAAAGGAQESAPVVTSTATTAVGTTASDAAHLQRIFIDGEEVASFVCDWTARRRVALPLFVVRWLRYVHGARVKFAAAEEAAARGGAKPTAASAGGAAQASDAARQGSAADAAAGSVTPVSPPRGLPASSANSLECMESGAVAGAVPETRHRRAVEERVVRAALETLAPLTQRAAAAKATSKAAPAPFASVASSQNGSSNSSAKHYDVPFDAFLADLGCAHLHLRAVASIVAGTSWPAGPAGAVASPPVTPQPARALMKRRNSCSFTGTATGSSGPSATGSEYVSALLYLVDVHAAGGDRVVSARTIAEEAAARITSQHGGDFAVISHALGQIAGIAISVASEADVVTMLRTHAVSIASNAIDCESSGGAFAGGPSRAETMRQLLDAGSETVTLLALPFCSLGAMYLLREIYDSLAAYFGSWSVKGFTDAMAAMSERGQRHSSSWSRLFRSMNRSRSGEITFTEFVGFFTKKVSACGEDMDADHALVLCLARLRLLHLLFFQRRGDWPGRSFWFDALVDVHDGDC